MKHFLRLTSVLSALILILLVIVYIFWHNHIVLHLIFIAGAISLIFAFIHYYVYHIKEDKVEKICENTYLKWCATCKKVTVHYDVPADPEEPDGDQLYQCNICKEYNGFV
jgi:hypothetical protein